MSQFLYFILYFRSITILLKPVLVYNELSTLGLNDSYHKEFDILITAIESATLITKIVLFFVFEYTVS